MSVKSTRTLGYSFKGEFDLENMTVTEYDNDGIEVASHNLLDKLEQFDGQEITISFNNKVKLENGVE